MRLVVSGRAAERVCSVVAGFRSAQDGVSHEVGASLLLDGKPSALGTLITEAGFGKD